MDAPKATVAPVRTADRLATIDVLRGFACLGILLMNIPTFGLPEQAYIDPRAWGDNGQSLPNMVTIVLVYLFGEGKMRAIFSAMFGASALLLISRGEEKGGGLRVADVYFRRTLWLLIFGMIHAYLIWWGDILFPYALMGLTLLWPFRHLKPKTLLIAASAMLLVITAAMVGEGFSNRDAMADYKRIAASDIESASLSDKDKKTYEDGLRRIRKQDVREIRKEAQKEVDAYRGNYAKNIEARAKNVWRFHAKPVYFPMFWDMLSMMFIGMALLKTGALTGERSFGFYAKMAIWGGLSGLAINGATMWLVIQHGFDSIKGPFDNVAYEIGRVPMALCYIAILVMLVKAGRAAWMTRRLQAVGQMAFSNYISHSLICSVIFYGGYGFGMIGKLERWQLYLVVAAIWTFNLTWSSWWLKRYHFGPLEWCWRSLTYWKRQPMRIRPAEPEAPVTEMLAEPSEPAQIDKDITAPADAVEVVPASLSRDQQ